MEPPRPYSDQATFYRTALLLGLIRGELVVRWADAMLAHAADAPAAFVEIATTPADDLTALREALLALGEAREPVAVVRALLCRVARDLTSGRRTVWDTMTVLGQVRRFTAVTPALNDELKGLGVDFPIDAGRPLEMARRERRVRERLAPYATAADGEAYEA